MVCQPPVKEGCQCYEVFSLDLLQSGRQPDHTFGWESPATVCSWHRATHLNIYCVVPVITSSPSNHGTPYHPQMMFRPSRASSWARSFFISFLKPPFDEGFRKTHMKQNARKVSGILSSFRLLAIKCSRRRRNIRRIRLPTARKSRT